MKDCSEDIISKNLLAQVDEEGYSISLDSEVHKSNKYVVAKRGKRFLRKANPGWKLLVAWKDGSETCNNLKYGEESNPVDVADFAKAKAISDEPVFAWCVSYILKKQDLLI